MSWFEISPFLSNVKRSGEGYSARCPAHDDRHNSLVIKTGMKRVFLKCYVGCSEQKILDSLNLKVSDLYFNSNPDQNGHRETREIKSNNTTEKKLKIVKKEEISSYDYRDENGKLLYQKVRYWVTFEDDSQGKTFSYRRFDENGRPIFYLNGVRRVPYRLPELLEALKTNPKQVIVLTEGEKDVDNVRKLGITATSFKDWLEEFNCHIKDLDTVLFVDHDEAGVRFANSAADIIYKAAKSIKMIDLFAIEPLPPKHGKDVSDWLEAGNSRDKLLEIIRSAPLGIRRKKAPSPQKKMSKL
jgi:hypothetical protein